MANRLLPENALQSPSVSLVLWTLFYLGLLAGAGIAVFRLSRRRSRSKRA